MAAMPQVLPPSSSPVAKPRAEARSWEQDDTLAAYPLGSTILGRPAMHAFTTVDRSTSPPRVLRPPRLQRRRRLRRPPPRRGPRRQARLRRRHHAPHLRRPRRAGEPRRQRAPRPRRRDGAARAARPPRHGALPRPLLRRDEDRRRPGAGEHPAHVGGLRLPAPRQPRPRDRRLRRAATEGRARDRGPALPRARRGGRRGRPAAPGRAQPLAPCSIAPNPALDAAPTSADDVAFWLYTSGSTGRFKGAVHLHAGSRLHGGALRHGRPRRPRGRPHLLRRQALLRLRPRQRA